MEAKLKEGANTTDRQEESAARAACNSSPSRLTADRSFMGDMLFEGVTQSGVDLFAAHGIALDASERAPGDVDQGIATADGTVGRTLALSASSDGATTDTTSFTSVSSFIGPQVHGYVVLSTTESVLRRSNGTSSPPDDWMAELANQFLGRFKNRLLRQGVPIQRMPPAVFRGQSTRLRNRHNIYEVVLSGSDGWVHIAVDLEPAVSSFDGAPACEDTAVPAEGELLLF